MFVISRSWKQEIKSAQKNKRKPSLLRAIVKTFGRLYCFVGLIQLILSAVFRLVNEICKEIYDIAACGDLVLLGYDAVVNPSSPC
jgi:hypothetical protein